MPLSLALLLYTLLILLKCSAGPAGEVVREWNDLPDGQLFKDR